MPCIQFFDSAVVQGFVKADCKNRQWGQCDVSSTLQSLVREINIWCAYIWHVHIYDPCCVVCMICVYLWPMLCIYMNCAYTYPCISMTDVVHIYNPCCPYICFVSPIWIFWCLYMTDVVHIYDMFISSVYPLHIFFICIHIFLHWSFLNPCSPICMTDHVFSFYPVLPHFIHLLC